MKKIVLIIVAILINITAISQTKDEACKIYTAVLQSDIPGSVVTYKKDTLIIILNIDVLSIQSKNSKVNIRDMISVPGAMNDLRNIIKTSIEDDAKDFYKDHLYYLKLIIEDDIAHNHKLYKSTSAKIIKK